MNDVLIKKLAKTITESTTKKPSAYDTSAEVRRIEGDTAWVHIPGGVDETPVQLTTNAKKGDIVQVRVSGGRAWLYGNVTAPPTDDTKANEAKKTADVADEHATDAVTSAMLAQQFADAAKEAADSAQADAIIAKQVTDEITEYAETAEKSVTDILQDAEDANIAAGEAQESAKQARLGLSTVEDVVNTVEWISKHGYYQLTTDSSVIEGKIYYTVTGTAIASPTGNPSLNLYYERSGTGTDADPYTYTPSDDTSVDSQKTYYTVSATSIAEPTGDPSENGYYELDFNSALSQYVSSHLALTDEGLVIINDNSTGSMLMSTSGIEIRNARGVTVGKYGESAIIGAETAGHIEIHNGEIYFYSGTKSAMTPYDPEADPFCVAYISDNELHIPRVVVVESLKMGKWKWDATINYHLSLVWTE